MDMICGIDEAGRGPVIGPLIVCGVAVESDEAIRPLGVRDSKKLTAKRREELAPRIREVAKVEVVEVSAEEIDALREEITLNELEARVFATIVERLKPEIAYMDAADANEAQFGRMVQAHMSCGSRLFSRHKADEVFPVVSAASIVAKVVRDARVAEIEAEIGEPIGSGYPSDPVTMSFLKRWIGDKKAFPPHTRCSWEPAQNLMRLNALRRLDSFEG
ncbi:MAG: ribonuclease HII [Thermoplasmata archaeon]|jgi:ribonuclease HII|nr:ribonuclease HII [Thermoplasmata archaeon]